MVLATLYAAYNVVKKGSTAFVVATTILSIILLIVLVAGWDQGWTTGRKMMGVVLFLCMFMLYRWRNLIELIIFPEDVIITKATEKMIVS